MCGIAGRVNFSPDHKVTPEQVRPMVDALRHRGPDDDGVWTHANVGLGHRRLSIIDLSPQGRNPMCNEDGSIWIVFNGEIYNFQELRPDLEAAGHRFNSNTDTEVILHLYEEYGAGCVQFLRGMFAFAIWDTRSRSLLLARDRMGVKPLYYSVRHSSLLFGSEIKAILRADESATAVDFTALHQFLLWQCIPAPRTGFRDIKKLPPASILTWRQGDQIKIEKYWTLEAAPPRRGNAAELVADVRNLVQEATRLRLIADVPVGVFLSGGVDSACVLAAVRKQTSGPVSTFSVAFGHKQFDESHHARQLAEHFNTDHHEFDVTPKVMELLPEMASLFDEPFADPAAVPTYYLSKLTREHVKVALSGDGGDEAFGGYQRYLALKALTRLSQVPGARTLAGLHRLIPYNASERSHLRYFREVLSLAGLPSRQQYRALLLGMVDEPSWNQSYLRSVREQIEDEDDNGQFLAGWNSGSADRPLTAAMLSDTLGYIPHCLNTKVDICSMACGLEVRSPFLDHKLVEMCIGIPESLKIRGVQQKYILKQAFKSEIPAAILHREKAGFGMPLADWFRDELRELAHDILLSPQARVRDIIEIDQIQSMLAEHASRKRNWHIPLWRLLVLETWLQSVPAQFAVRSHLHTESLHASQLSA